MLRKTLFGVIYVFILASIINAADTEVQGQQNKASEQNQQGFMLMLGENTAIYDRPDGIKVGILAKNLMVWVEEQKDNLLRINTVGWIKFAGASSQEPPFSLMLGKKSNIYNQPGDKKEIATIYPSVSVTIIALKDGYAKISVNGWLHKPGTSGSKIEKEDPYADLKDKGNTVVDIIGNRIIYDPRTSLSR